MLATVAVSVYPRSFLAAETYYDRNANNSSMLNRT